MLLLKGSRDEGSSRSIILAGDARVPSRVVGLGGFSVLGSRFVCEVGFGCFGSLGFGSWFVMSGSWYVVFGLVVASDPGCCFGSRFLIRFLVPGS